MVATADPETQLEWELITASYADTSTNEVLITFLVSRCRALELLQTTQSQKTGTANTRSSHSTGNKFSAPSYIYVTTLLQFSLCSGSNRRFKYDIYLKLHSKQRLTHVMKSGLCFNCMQPFTKDHSFSKHVCRQSNKRHYTLTHLVRQNQSKIDKKSTNISLPADLKGNRTAQINTYCSFKRNPGIKIVCNIHFLCSEYSVQYFPCRLLLDSASQSHFITD